MNIPRRSLLLGLAAVVLAGCAARPEVSRIEDPAVDWRAYRSFAFVQDAQPASLLDRRVLAAARHQLELRGYRYDELVPDLLVNIGALVEQRQGLRSTPGHFPGWGTVETEDYRLGRMAIDLIDARRQQVVWHGAAEGRVSAAMLRDAGSAVEKAVAVVFEGFPVPARGDARTAATAPQPATNTLRSR